KIAAACQPIAKAQYPLAGRVDAMIRIPPDAMIVVAPLAGNAGWHRRQIASTDKFGHVPTWKIRRGTLHAPSRCPPAAGVSPPRAEGRRWRTASGLAGHGCYAAGRLRSWRATGVHRPTTAPVARMSAKTPVDSVWTQPILYSTIPALPQSERKPAMHRHSIELSLAYNRPV